MLEGRGIADKHVEGELGRDGEGMVERDEKEEQVGRWNKHTMIRIDRQRKKDILRNTYADKRRRGRVQEEEE